MILVDTNLLVYAVDSSSPFHEEARSWPEGRLNGAGGVGLPWPVLNGSARLVSNPDAHLAALAMEYGLVLCSTDADFDRFPGLAWQNPLA